MKRSSLFGMFLLTVGALGFVGSVTGRLPAMLAAMFDNKDLVSISATSSSKPAPGSGVNLLPNLGPIGSDITKLAQGLGIVG